MIYRLSCQRQGKVLMNKFDVQTLTFEFLSTPCVLESVYGKFYRLSLTLVESYKRHRL